jgi:hypothetical protein
LRTLVYELPMVLHSALVGLNRGIGFGLINVLLGLLVSKNRKSRPREWLIRE